MLPEWVLITFACLFIVTFVFCIAIFATLCENPKNHMQAMLTLVVAGLSLLLSCLCGAVYFYSY